MSHLMDYTRFLAKEIGPRPTGTEEEQQAALYITEQFQKSAGFTANIEEFQRMARPDLSQALLGLIAVVVTLLAMFLPMLVIPAFILVALAAAAFVMEIMGTPLLSRVLARGASQNVVARYQPNSERETAHRAVSRKIILVAHYDSGRVTPPLLERLNFGKISFEMLCAGGMVAAALFALIRVFVAISGGGALVILNVLTALAILVCLLPIIKYVLMNGAVFNEGANNNASGSAALIEIARRISRGSVSEADLANYSGEVVIHGEEAALNEGLVPDGAQITYEATETTTEEEVVPDAESEEKRLLAAKEAIAALTGKPVERRVYRKAEEPAAESFSQGNIAGEAPAMTMVEPEQIEVAGEVVEPLVIQPDVVEVVDFDAETTAQAGTPTYEAQAERAPQRSSLVDVWRNQNGANTVVATSTVVNEEAPSMASAPAFSDASETFVSAGSSEAAAQASDSNSGGFQNVPSWFAAAQKNAKRTPAPASEIHRSRYTEALERAERERIEQEQAQLRAEQERLDAELRQREEQAIAALATKEEADLIAADAAAAANDLTDASFAQDIEQSQASATFVEVQSDDPFATRMASPVHVPVDDAEIRAAEQAAAGLVEDVEIGTMGGRAVGADLSSYIDDASMARDALESSTMSEAVIADVQEEVDIVDVAVESLPNLLRVGNLPKVDGEEDHLQQSDTAPSVRLAAEDVRKGETEQAARGADHTGRLRALRNNIPSLSGVIRTKNAAHEAAVKSVPDVLHPAPHPQQGVQATPDVEAQVVSDMVVETIDASGSPAPSRDIPDLEPLPATGIGRAAKRTVPDLVSTPDPREAPAARITALDDDEVDYDMRVSDFNPAIEDDFAADLVSDFGDFSEQGDFAVVEEADDGFGGTFGSTGGIPSDEVRDGYEEMPRSRRSKRKGGLFSRFLGKDKAVDESMESPQEWLGVGDDFDARSAGRARGGWESFRSDDYDSGIDDPFAEDDYDTFGDFGSDDDGRYSRRRNWEGGAYSRMSLGHVDMRSGQDAEGDEAIPDMPPEAEHDRFVTGEIEKIYHFRNPAFNTEIWFVAMGCDDDSHDGVRAFLAEHKSELRGSMVIEVESLGAGKLSYASREGSVKKVSASSRIKGYTREAVSATGVALDSVDLSGEDSIASIVQKAGFQSMHLFGSEDGRIALKGSPDDVLENLDELVFNENVNFVYELLKR